MVEPEASPSAASLLYLEITPWLPPACIPPLFNLVLPLLMQHLRPTLAFKPLIPLPPILYLLLLPHHRFMLPAVSLHLLLPFSPDPAEFSNGMLEVSEPGAHNCYTFFRLIPLTLFVSRNPTLIHLSLSGSLDSLLRDLISPTTGLAFFLLISPTLAAVSSFSSHRAYPLLIFILPLFLRLTPTLIM